MFVPAAALTSHLLSVLDLARRFVLLFTCSASTMNTSASDASLTSSSSGILTDKEVKKLEKILASEASAEQKHLDTAMKDLKKAEKALNSSTKVRISLCCSERPSSGHVPND